jgi:cardiolipin synthase
VLYGEPTLGSTNAERFFALSITGAQRRLYVTSAYFVPVRQFRSMLRDAARRGVDVRILTPGGNTDQTSTWYAARAHYEHLLEAGVRIYEYRPTMIHAKTLVADGTWCAIGSLNFDNRSIALNDEVALVAQDASLGERMERIFLDDLDYADELDLATFRKRGLAGRVREVASARLSRWL